MSNSAPTPSHGSEAVAGSHFTVEDTGTTTNAADLFQNDTTTGSPDRAGSSAASTSAHAVSGEDAPPSSTRSTGAAVVAGSAGTTPARAAGDRSGAPESPASPTAPGAPEAPAPPTGGLAALADDGSIGHVFDQTNGVIDGLGGDSDGTVDSDERSGAERGAENPAFEAFADTEAQPGDGGENPRTTGS
jgi:hypothetical protein